MVKSSTFKKTFQTYLKTGLKLETYQKLGIAMLVFVVSGVVGWIYEFIFARINDGGWYMQGGNLLPWINIYAIGALAVITTTYKFRRKPWLVFIISFFVTGIIELVGGWLVYVIGNGARYWDYNNLAWNFGNIGGFVCLFSVTIFAIFSLVLMYFIYPFCIYLSQKMSKRAFLTLAITLFTLILLDELTNLTLKTLNLPTAMDFYRSLGFKYLEF